jgi:hypothetical protein
MRTTPRGWKTLFAKLGVGKRRGRRAGRTLAGERRLRFESLEERRVLAVYTVNTDVDEIDFGGSSTTLSLIRYKQIAGFSGIPLLN